MCEKLLQDASKHDKCTSKLLQDEQTLNIGTCLFRSLKLLLDIQT